MKRHVDILGRAAYEAYCQSTGGVSAVSGALLPTWDQQAEPIRVAWRAAADAVRMMSETLDT